MKHSSKETYILLKKNKDEGIAVMYERYGRKLYGYAVATWKVEEDEAWDLVYKTLYKVADNISNYTFESEKKFGAIVFKIFINYLRKNYRTTQKMKEHVSFANFSEARFEGNGVESHSGVEQAVKTKITKASIEADNSEKEEDSLSMELLKKELEKLEDWQRMLLLLKSQNMPYSEIAKYIDKPAGQLKVYYQRLKDRVMKNINAELMPAAKTA